MQGPAVEDPLWRGVDVFRTLALAYAAVTVAQNLDDYARPRLGLAVLLVMTVWTLSFWLRPFWTGRSRRAGPVRTRSMATVVTDLVLACGAAASTALVDTPARIADGVPTLPTVWAASAVLSWAVWRGALGGVAAALSLSTVDVLVSGRMGGNTLHNNVLLLLLGGVIGYCADLFRSSHLALRQALAVEAATAERERLARDIHDSVLQVLAFVQRRATEIGGDARELGRLAGEQERRLRTLVSSRPTTSGDGDGLPGELDLRQLLATLDSERVSVVSPAEPVRLPRHPALELAAAVQAAVDNAQQHAGEQARAWVLVDDEGDHVCVTVRDDGAGIPDGRLAQAAADGRLGVAQSVHGRLADLGGTSSVLSAVGEGTEVSMRLPRRTPRGS